MSLKDINMEMDHWEDSVGESTVVAQACDERSIPKTWNPRGTGGGGEAHQGYPLTSTQMCHGTHAQEHTI